MQRVSGSSTHNLAPVVVFRTNEIQVWRVVDYLEGCQGILPPWDEDGECGVFRYACLMLACAYKTVEAEVDLVKCLKERVY